MKGKIVMNPVLIERCELLLRNREAMRVAFPWDAGKIHVCCAALYTMRGREANPASVKASLALLKQRMGAFSEFRGTARNVLVCLMELSGDPQDMLERAAQVYALLRQEFFSSAYLPVAAMTIAQHAQPVRYAELAHRTRALYERMRKEHPFLTSSEDTGLCALLALSQEEDEVLLSRMEEAYTVLRQRFSYANAVQSLSHVLTLLPGDTKEKCARLADCYDAFRMNGNRWGRDYELPVLGVLCEDPRPFSDLVQETVACSDYLKGRKGFGFFSDITRPQRLMFAGLLTRQNDPAAATATINSTLAAIIAEHAAVCCCVTASAAAANTASHA